jgi:hypothetical protein
MASTVSASMNNPNGLTMAQRLELWKASKTQNKGDGSLLAAISIATVATTESSVSTTANNNSTGKKQKKPAEASGLPLNGESKVKKPMITNNNSHTAVNNHQQQAQGTENKKFTSENQNFHPNIQTISSDTGKNTLAPTAAAYAELEEKLRVTQLDLDKANTDNELLRAQLAVEQANYEGSEQRFNELECLQADILVRAKAAIEEVGAMSFENSIQAMKISELEQIMTRDRIEASELVSMKTKKHKEDLQRLANERLDYEGRANTMIQEVNEQMLQLQQMAMQRIEQLERELMEETTKSRQLQDQIDVLKSPRAASPVPMARAHSNTHNNNINTHLQAANNADRGDSICSKVSFGSSMGSIPDTPPTPSTPINYAVRRRRGTKIRLSTACFAQGSNDDENTNIDSNSVVGEEGAEFDDIVFVGGDHAGDDDEDQDSSNVTEPQEEEDTNEDANNRSTHSISSLDEYSDHDEEEDEELARLSGK